MGEQKTKITKLTKNKDNKHKHNKRKVMNRSRNMRALFNTMSFNTIFFHILLFAAIFFTGCKCNKEKSPQRLKIATTTSLHDTGLWDYLGPVFEKKLNIKVDFIYAGTGIALEYGRRGDVDLVIVHSKEEEEKFVSDGYGLKRIPFAYNHFLIVGPKNDPASINSMTPEEAFKQLYERGKESFISRGDNSGTHNKEKAIWKSAGYDYDKVRKSGKWYIEAGKGMGPLLLMASEKQAYALSDIATFTAYKGKLDLEKIVAGGDVMLNVYSVIACNPKKNPGVNAKAAETFIRFLTKPETLEKINNYRAEEFGMSIFKKINGASKSAL